MQNVLLVEGDSVAADLATRYFSWQGYDTRRLTARNAEHLDVETRYGIILIDFNTGGMAEDQFLNKIKKKWSEAALVFTAFKATARDATRLGIPHVLPKPFSVEQMSAFFINLRQQLNKF